MNQFMARDKKLPRYGASRSYDYLYVYENFAPGNFGVLKQIKITDANREYIASIEVKIGENNGESIIGSTSELNRVLEVLKIQARRNRRNNALDSEGRADSDNGGISLGESEGDGKRNSQKGNGNKQGIKYGANVIFKDKPINIVINVGLGINDKKYHIYAITNYKKEAVAKVKTNAPGPSGLPDSDGFFEDSITHNTNLSTTFDKKIQNFL